ncbi:hypothetical protein RA27_17505, partial [Ruegeria sp. ANG-R]|uniref:plastocyanin/azurin family copper-binding protein n=1 Tax=Ruegeria sp. ANG-R TaxID=1577903 RepID=UPI00057DE83A
KLRKTFDLQLNTEGVYGYKCTPHYQKGMVGLIVVGNPSGNLTQAMSVKTPAGAQMVFDSLFMQAKAISLAY